VGARKPLLEVFVIAVLLAAMRLAVDISFAYLAIMALTCMVLCLVGLAVRRLMQRRFREAVLIIGLCAIPYVVPSFIDAAYWKFRLHRPGYWMP
jgi:hypothetical protein